MKKEKEKSKRKPSKEGVETAEKGRGGGGGVGGSRKKRRSSRREKKGEGNEELGR